LKITTLIKRDVFDELAFDGVTSHSNMQGLRCMGRA